ncbi:MAG TPA: NifU family protein [Patescibacteria group bacterium]|nr:NifU family protein [Patescibacteria group bacterium]
MSFKEKVEKFIDQEIRPSLEAHGGGIDVVGVAEGNGRVELKLTGTCAGCPLADLTFADLVKHQLLNGLPEVKEVIASND